MGDGSAMAGHRKLAGNIHLGPMEHGFLNGMVWEREGATAVSPKVTSAAEKERQAWGSTRRPTLVVVLRLGSCKLASGRKSHRKVG